MKKHKHSSRNTLLWLIVIILLILAAEIYIAFGGTNQKAPEKETDFANPTDGNATQTEVIAQAESTIPEENLSEAPPKASDQLETSEPGTTSDLSTEPAQVETQPPVVIVQKANAEYEKWLSAALVVGVSMEYPDFIPEGIFTDSETSIEDKASSNGAYIIFTSGGTRMAIHAKPLQQERTKADSRDISADTIGFATFDLVDPNSIDIASMKSINMEDLGELIAQSLLVSIYTH